MSFATLERESALWEAGCRYVVGLDEVGRGPLAGPVIAGATVFERGGACIEGLRDSKQMTAKERERVAAEIREVALFWSLAAASVREIDRINIRRATALAMRRAIARLGVIPDYILVDGLELPELGRSHEALVKGDSSCQSIAAAAVLAKVVRDRLMNRLSVKYPDFGWSSNKGYATAQHLAALDTAGPSPHHRSSFTPVAQTRLF